jgi:hypothetical protein
MQAGSRISLPFSLQDQGGWFCFPDDRNMSQCICKYHHGLAFMKAMGIRLWNASFLGCLPFPVDFQCTSNHVPVLDKRSSRWPTMQRPLFSGYKKLNILSAIMMPRCKLEDWWQFKTLLCTLVPGPPRMLPSGAWTTSAQRCIQPRVCQLGGFTTIYREQGFWWLASKCPWERQFIVSYSLLAIIAV